MNIFKWDQNKRVFTWNVVCCRCCSWKRHFWGFVGFCVSWIFVCRLVTVRQFGPFWLDDNKQFPFKTSYCGRGSRGKWTEANFLLAPASPPNVQIYERELFVIIQSERTKRRDGYRSARENPATPPSVFDCWIFQYYLRSSASSFGRLSNIMVWEETLNFQLALYVIWKPSDRNL